jgi:sec-independent protein translocase protein TatB
MSWPGFWEMVFLGILALLIFGPERLPKMAQTAGEMIAKFKREAAGTLDELKAAAELDEFTGVAKELRDTTDDLRRTVDIRSDLAADPPPVKPQSAVMAGTADTVRTTPPPFDPDTP